MSNNQASEFAIDIEKIFLNFGKVPLYGGWGYEKEEAIIINKYDFMVDNNYPFNGIGLEYALIQHRNWIEFISAKQSDERYAEIDFDMIKQELIVEDSKIYDYIQYETSCFLKSDYVLLQNEWELNYGSKGFDIDDHIRKRATKRKFFTREIWFEISSFYGEPSPYRWDYESGPFFRRTDNTSCPIIPVSIAEKTRTQQRNALRLKEKQ